jgi:hypothetical protein
MGTANRMPATKISIDMDAFVGNRRPNYLPAICYKTVLFTHTKRHRTINNHLPVFLLTKFLKKPDFSHLSYQKNMSDFLFLSNLHSISYLILLLYIFMNDFSL